MAITYNTSVNVKGKLQIRGEDVALAKDLIALENNVDSIVESSLTPVQEKVATLEKGINNHYETTAAAGVSDMDAIATATSGKTLLEGDTAVVKHVISSVEKNGVKTEKHSYTAYVYDEQEWKAMDGNYDASNVFFAEDITMAGEYTQVGNLSKNKTATGTLEAKGKSLKEVMMSIFTKRLQPGTPTQPAVTTTLTNAGSKEVGSTFSPEYSASLSAGSYTYGPATGVSATEWKVYNSIDGNTEGKTKSTASGSFDSFKVTDGTNYTITAMALHGEGAVAKDNLGDPSNPEKKISAATSYTGTANQNGSFKSKASSSVTGYRNWYMNIADAIPATVDSAYVRNYSKGKAKEATTQSKVSIPKGTKYIFVALPDSSTYGYTKVLRSTTVDTSMGAPADLSQGTVTVYGATAGEDGMTYKIWEYKNVNGTDTDQEFTFNIA